MYDNIGLSNKQKDDIDSIIYFIPKSMNKANISREDIISFLGYSDKGISIENISPGINALIWGKKWRDIFVGIYEEGVLEGTMPYCDILIGMPNSVIKFLSKSMFSGIAKDKILEFLNNK